MLPLIVQDSARLAKLMGTLPAQRIIVVFLTCNMSVSVALPCMQLVELCLASPSGTGFEKKLEAEVGRVTNLSVWALADSKKSLIGWFRSHVEKSTCLLERRHSKFGLSHPAWQRRGWSVTKVLKSGIDSLRYLPAFASRGQRRPRPVEISKVGPA